MSISTIKFASKSISAQEEILEFFLQGDVNHELTQEEADYIASRRGRDHDKLMQKLTDQGKSAGARYIAARINSGAPADLKQLASDWWCHRAIVRELSKDELQEIGARPMDLRLIGIKTGWQARRFYNLYKEVMVKGRVWGSSNQVNQVKVLMVATTPNFNRLPLGVKKGLIEYAPYIQTERVGDIWRLSNCLRAWKWNKNLPKSIAEKVGRMPFRNRIIAALAWQEVGNPNLYWDAQGGWQNNDRATIIQKFWESYRSLERQSLICLLSKITEKWGTGMRWGIVRCIVETWLGLPYESLKDEWITPKDLRGNPNEKIEGILANWGSPKDACFRLFGCNGKATVKALQQCQSRDTWKWAAALAHGNADSIQKILRMESLIEWEPDAVDFLLSLPMISRLRMLQATEFKYRGETQTISRDHVRDTGYLWKNIQNKPELGRVRCWFSVHETLAAAYVKELPDEAIPIPEGWERVDGLCAVDGSWELEFPRRVATLKYYGEILHNCVGGYGEAIKQGRSVIFVVREKGILTHCVEMIPNGDCQQFSSSGNGIPDIAIKNAVLGALRQAGLAE